MFYCKCFVTPGDRVHIRQFDSDLRTSLSAVPLKWKKFVAAIQGEAASYTYDHHNQELKFRSVLLTLVMRDEPPFSKQVIYDTLKSPEIGLHDLAEKWKRNYMVSILYVCQTNKMQAIFYIMLHIFGKQH